MASTSCFTCSYVGLNVPGGLTTTVGGATAHAASNSTRSQKITSARNSTRCGVCRSYAYLARALKPERDSPTCDVGSSPVTLNGLPPARSVRRVIRIWRRIGVWIGIGVVRIRIRIRPDEARTDKDAWPDKATVEAKSRPDEATVETGPNEDAAAWSDECAATRSDKRGTATRSDEAGPPATLG